MECKEVWSDRAYATAVFLLSASKATRFNSENKKKNYVGVNNIRSAFSIYLYFILIFSFPPQK